MAYSEHKLVSKEKAIEWFEKCLASIKSKKTFTHKIVTVMDLGVNASVDQHGYLFKVVYPYLLAREIENGNERYIGFNPKRKDSIDSYDYDMRYKFYYELIQHPDYDFQVPMPKRLKKSKAYMAEVSRYIEQLLQYGDTIGIIIKTPDQWKEELNDEL